MFKKNVFFYSILLLIAGFSLQAQTITLKGKVLDSLQQPLHYANLLAVPNAEDVEVTFAITNQDGHYKLKLQPNKTYTITTSYLGYLPNAEAVTLDNDTIKNIVLKENPNQLDEVTIKYTPPITVKKDTIIYLTDKFVTGEERKLKDVLKKLPGVDVDRKGNVTVNGKKVTKVLVEDKTFFTGSSKLAVNNIPADAVDKVEILDNYSEVAMLKGLQDSEDMAMNIKLKEDKKNFVFGDLEAGAGYRDRYIIHPNVFYYSPKTNVNLIGDINNTGFKSFTFKDYLEFEGGFGKLLNDASSYFGLYNSDFTQFLNNQDYKSSTNQFGALNIRQTINKETDISGYIITNNEKKQTETNTINSYQNIDIPFAEQRNTNNNLNNFFTIGKITLEYNPTTKEDLAFNNFVKLTNNTSNGLITTQSNSLNNSIYTLTDSYNVNLKQNLTYSRKLSKKHTATLEATYNYQNDQPITNWITNQEILQGLIPLQIDSNYNILHSKTVKSNNANIIVKDYWVLNNFNHLYTSLGVNTAFNSFKNTDLQQLSNGFINDFASSGFNNNLDYNFTDTFIGLEYKFQIGIATFKPATYFHFYNWQVQELEDKVTKNKALVLPQFTGKIELSNSQKINIKYKLNASFPSINRLANNFILNSFNSVFKGDQTLDNTLYHNANISYYKFSLFKGLNYNINANYNKRIKSYKNVVQLQGIEQFSTPILFNQPEQNVTINGRISKKIKKLKFNYNTRWSYRDYYQIINQTTNLNVSKGLENTISIETSFKKHPNIKVGYTTEISNYKAISTTTQFKNTSFFVDLEYDFLNDFIFKADYSLDTFNNKRTNNSNQFDVANVSLFYQKEDSPWGFEINATNIFNVKFRQNNSFSDFLIQESKTFILPRMILLKLAYKL
ncbi:carboxypeptidase-like regulatory domain-containing protein [Olleya aquimaris]|uniref:Carboxypeptidase-like regulatory domain-containing protein n=1 Tax=Olleya sediminilitoris TaxID=2795739 RepID=A0ABS1WHD7_9FLAO|nr:carboxypeptidase-like regulatory domain-containing protein [Olleya sediminilitoris]AXO80802.1 carboxypeptidase-like regulatory domain-containing protein [Olleya aquimaris]MBL7558531.1 carboxypeptidase-like regulatory domain-containing protein [Olleya sediminilitoris]